MNEQKHLTILIILSLICFGPLNAADLKVEDITVASLSWGNQTAKIKLTNLSYDYKTIVIKTDLSFEGSELNPKRTSKKPFIIDPIYSATLNEPIEIPGNYGALKLKFTFYDVVDTLDPLYESQVFFTKEISNSFPVPEGMKAYLGAPLALPMFVDRSPLFDNQFTRYYFLFLKLGKKPEEIAGLMKTNLNYINFIADKLVAGKYLVRSGGENIPNFAVVDNSALTTLRPIINETTEKLYSAMKANLPKYDSVMTAMVSRGELTRDRDNIMEIGSVLYHKYPVILGLLLWNKIGREFINDGPRFSIFENSDPCRADMGEFMYMAVSASDLSGRSFYYDLIDVDGERFHTSIGDVSLVCEPVGESYKVVNKYYWNFLETDFPIIFSYDDETNSDLLAILGEGCVKLTEPLKEAINKLYLEGKDLRKVRGARYWSWNLVITGVMDKLDKSKLAVKEGNGIYTFQKSEE